MAGVSKFDPILEPEEQVPLLQRLLDNEFLLLAVGLLIPILSYLAWGLIELISLPVIR